MRFHYIHGKNDNYYIHNLVKMPSLSSHPPLTGQPNDDNVQPIISVRSKNYILISITYAGCSGLFILIWC